MLIWDIIRDWFVMNIWGGLTSQGDYYSTFLGMFKVQGVEIQPTDSIYCDNLFVPVGDVGLEGFEGYIATHIGSAYMSFGDWLSTTSTIIVLLAVCFALYFLVRYFFRMFAGLISGR